APRDFGSSGPGGPGPGRLPGDSPRPPPRGPGRVDKRARRAVRGGGPAPRRLPYRGTSCSAPAGRRRSAPGPPGGPRVGGVGGQRVAGRVRTRAGPPFGVILPR